MLENKDAPITYNGVVYNEMKGAYLQRKVSWRDLQ